MNEHLDIPCESTNDKWICIGCCDVDGCNINSASKLSDVGLRLIAAHFILGFMKLIL